MGKLQRDRGASTEREVATYLSEQLGVVVKRKLGQARDSGEDISVPPYRIEVKRRKQIAALAFLKQCEVGCADSEIPVVVMRVDGDLRPVVMLRLEHFVFLMRETMDVTPAPVDAKVCQPLSTSPEVCQPLSTSPPRNAGPRGSRGPVATGERDG